MTEERKKEIYAIITNNNSINHIRVNSYEEGVEIEKWLKSENWQANFNSPTNEVLVWN